MTPLGRTDANLKLQKQEKPLFPVQANTEKEAVLNTLSPYKQGKINLNHAAPGNFTMEAIKASEGTDLR